MSKRSLFRKRPARRRPTSASADSLPQRRRNLSATGNLSGSSRTTTEKQARLETLEKRELLAVDLVSVSADVAEQFDLAPGAINTLNEPPRQLTFRFDGNAVIDPASLSSGIIITPAGGDGTFDGDEVPITPGFLGLGQSDRVVVARFAGDLPDDLYRITVSNDPITGLRDITGMTLDRRVDVRVNLELGPRVVAVVPQPIVGGVGDREQQDEQIEVFFNEDPLSNPAAGVIDSAGSSLPVVTAANYRLFLTQDTIENTDDVVTTPTSVQYDPVANKATLTFADGTLTGGGTFRLRIGSGEDVAAMADRGPVVETAIENNTGGTNDLFVNAQRASQDFGIDAGLQSVVFEGGEIRNPQEFVLPWPGAYENPGIRQQRRDAKFTRPIDTTIGINVYSYNFAELYGLDSQGQLLDNAITEAQKQRVREALDLYEQNLGVRFVETEDSGLQIVNGDLRGVQQTADVGAGDGTPKSIYRINERDPSRGVLVLDASENFFDGFGLSPDDRPSFFVEAIRGIGNVIGIGELFELPTGTDGAIGSQDEPNSETYSNDGDNTAIGAVVGFPTPAGEPDFLSHAAKVIGQSVNRPESSDVDFYEFSVVRPMDQTGSGNVGEVVIETYAQRLDNASLLDSMLQLYRVTGDPGSESYELISRNDDSFGDDSMLRLSLAAGRYIVGVSSTGNDSYYGELADSGNGGRSEGRYDLRVTFTPSVDIDGGTLSGLSDTDGTLLDGDADGVAGGNFNFWFRTTNESTSGETRTIFVSKDGDGSAVGDGSIDQPLDTVEDALALATPGDIVRLLPSLGADDDLETTDDNNAYEIGFGGPNDARLGDGSTLEVPRGVTVMIDAGAIVKLRDAKIVVGSESTTEDRSEAALQVLGTPENNVILTSFNETTLGNNSNPLNVTPRAGDWSGIEFRNDVDIAEAFGTYANEGIFIDYVSNADIRFGGGSVTASAPAVAPIQLAESRPTIIYNTISNSAGPAVSADPNSFREDLFNSPRFQQRLDVSGSDNNRYQFTSDYDRVGPEITGNSLQNNSINGLFVRVATPTAGQTETLTVPGRFDDTDIAHIISETLEVSGNPGGPTLQEDRPNISGVSPIATNGVGGEIPAGTYEYRLSFVTPDGQESLISLPTRTVTVNGAQAVELRGLPTAPAEFAGRRLYRGISGGSNYELVDTLNATATRFVDTLSDDDIRGGSPQESVITSFNANSVTVTPIGSAGVFPLGIAYDYRFTFADPFGGESQASNSTMMAVAPQDGAFELTDIPTAPDGFIGTNVFRLDPATGQYVLIAELRNGQTTLIDDGQLPFADPSGELASLLGRVLGDDADGGTKLLPRFDARLTVDPGIIVKMNAARIEANFGADFYAEGTPERPIFFTSLSDDSVGASQNFDADNNGATFGAPGQWGGISIRQQATGSFDYANIRFGGGDTVLAGGVRGTNPLEILQSEVRVTNSVFENNDNGFGANGGGDNRFGVGFNTPATIFIRGAQPILVGNTLTNESAAAGSGAAISINPDALTSRDVVDWGRATGPINRLATNADNQGPLFEDNLIGNHRINGLEIRGETITVDSVWDDTDITHVVTEAIASLTNAYGGSLRLRSSSSQSLVVKFGQDGSLIAGGRPLDIEDRIGGTLQVLGTDAFPVVLTSLNDDSVGSGYTPDGRAATDTLGVELLDGNGDPIEAAPGDWQGLQILAYANDRNVSYQYEAEAALQGDNNANGTPQVAETLGTIARGELAGDENARLGFKVRGTLATADDIDTYAFDATGQTLVTIDIDETSFGLDTVVELVTVDGEVITRSDNSYAESIGRESIFVDESVGSGVVESDVRPMTTTIDGRNVESPNRGDAGLRVVLPGDASQTNTFYVRVRTAAGVSSGQYTLSLRLDDDSEVAGSTIRRADIRYATTAILVTAAPTSSPLTDEASEEVRLIDPTPGDRNSGDERAVESVDTRLNANFNQAQSLGNLLTSDRGVLSVSGEIGNLDNSITGGLPFESLIDERLEDVDVYKVDLFAQQIRPDVFDSENRYVTTTFDIDYADQLGRPNTRISVFDSAGRLILTGNDSSIADDNAPSSDGSGTSSLSGGSQGIRDAYIGPVELPEGTYYVAVTSVATVPQNLNQFFEPNATEPFTRLLPIDSSRLLSYDSFEELISIDPDSGAPVEDNLGRIVEYQAERPINSSAFGTDPLDEGGQAIVPYNLSDISLFVSFDRGIDGPDRTSLAQFNPFTGELIRVAGDSPNAVGDIAIRTDGELYSYATSQQNGEMFTPGTVGGYQNISPVDGGVNSDSDDGITFSRSNEAFGNTENDPNAVLIIDAMVFDQIRGDSPINRNAVTNNNSSFFLAGQRSNNGRGGEIPETLTRNLLYIAGSGTGEIGSGRFGSLNGMADRDFPDNTPYTNALGPAAEEVEVGIVDVGQFDPVPVIPNITGLARSQANTFNRILVAVTDQGGIYEFDVDAPRISTPDDSDAAGYDNVIPSTSYGMLELAPDHFAFTNSPRFTGVTYGPRSVEGGEFEDVLFATTEDGWMYAFRLGVDEATGEPQAEPANVFYNGRFAVELATVFDAPVAFLTGQTNGLAFSNVVANPWHVTNDRFDDDGHGIVTPYGISQTPLAIGGGSSLYFGYEVENGNNPNNSNTVSRGDNDPLGDIAPGGAHGSVISDQFDLSEYTAGDEPALYFTYHIEVEAQDDYRIPAPLQNDSFRVFGADDDGQWELLATNNDFRSLPNADEYDNFFRSGIPVQEIFDDNANNGNWRQARVDLSPLAGSENVRIRFDFNTAGAARHEVGSIELVGVAGDKIDDNSTTTLVNELGTTVVLQSIVGQDLVFAADDAGFATIGTGDSIDFTDADGIVTTVQYVDVLSTAPLAPNTVEVLLPTQPDATDPTILNRLPISPLQAARLTAAALPTSLGAAIESNGSVSVTRAIAITPNDTISAGVSTPSSLADPGSLVLQTPTSIEAVAGETLTVTIGGISQTFTYVPTPDPTDPMAPVVAADEFEFDETIADPALQDQSVALEVSSKINAAFGGPVTFVAAGDVVFNVPEDQVAIARVAGPTEIMTETLGATPGVYIEVGDAASFTDNEFLTLISDSTGTPQPVDVVFDLNGSGGNAGQIVVNVPAGATATQIRDAAVAAISADARFTARPQQNIDGDETALEVNQTNGAFTLDFDPDAVPGGLQSLRFRPYQNVDLPDGRGIRSGETLLIDSGGVQVELVLVRFGDEFTPTRNQVVVDFFEFDTDETLGRRIADELNAFSPLLGAVPTDEGFGLGGRDAEPVTLGVDPIATSFERTEGFDSFSVPLTVPAASQLNDGDQITVFLKNSPGDQAGTVITFVEGTPDDPTTPIDPTDSVVVYDADDTAVELADRIRNEIAFLRPDLAAAGDRVVEFAALAGIETGDTAFISFMPIVDTSTGVDIRAVPIVVSASDSMEEVAASLQVALINSLGYFAQDGFGTGFNLETRATAGNYNIEAGSRIRLYETTLVDAGSYGSSTFLPGDAFGESVSFGFSRNNVRTAGAENNQIEGVYIDDIILGFAERGEAVIYENYLGVVGGGGGGNVLGANATFDIDPAFVPDTRADAVQPENPDEVVVGNYKLQIRTADNYGVPQDYDPINLVLDESIGAGRSFDTNDRLVDGAVSIVVPEVGNLIDGDRFVLDDGRTSVTFEFNNALQVGDVRDQIDEGNIPINFLPTDTQAVLAARVRDAINSEQFRLSSDGNSSDGSLRIFAISGDGRTAGETSSSRVELFGDNIVVNPTQSSSVVDEDANATVSNGRFIKIDAIESETPFGDFSSRRIPIVDQEGRTVTYAQYQGVSMNAQPTGYVAGDTLVVDGKIGDEVSKGIANNVSADDGSILPTNPQRDSDLFRVYLEDGERIAIDVDSTGLFRDSSVLGLPVITVFPRGISATFDDLTFANESAFSSFLPEQANGEAFGGAFLEFEADGDGFYDIMVSSQFFFQNTTLVPLGVDGFFDTGFGEYQLTVRPASPTGVPERDVLLVDYQFGKTDVNRTIDQGQLIIEQNIIRDFADVGIDAVTQRGLAGASGNNLIAPLGVNPATQSDDLSVPGSAGLLRNQNTFGLITGTVIVNNLVVDTLLDENDVDATTGIRINGGTFANGESPGPNIYARIINNTVVGDGNGTGIEIDGRAAPTIVNNVLVDLENGLVVDTTTASLTETAANVIAGVDNPSTVPIGQSTFVLADADGLFLTNADGRLFIPADDSVLIDSSIGSIADREELFNTVKQSVGFAASPILAPRFDATGNLRVDTPGQGTAGTGQNVFADRGALDNADDRGPVARLTTPLDLIELGTTLTSTATNGDSDPAPAVVRLVEDASLPFIEVELSDRGVGIDPSSVTAGGVTLRENGRVLTEGVDYLFGYSSAGATIRLTSTRGEFLRDATYEIELGRSIVDLAGNPLAATNARDQTLLTILTAGVNFDYGDAPAPYRVTAADNGPSHANPGINSPRLGNRVDVEDDGTNSPNSLADDALAAIVIDAAASTGVTIATITGGSTLTIDSVPAVGDTIDFILGTNVFTVEFVDTTTNPTVGNIAVDTSSGDVTDIRQLLAGRIRAEIRQQSAGIEVTDVSIDDTIADNEIRFTAFDDEDGVPIGAYTTPGGETAYLFGNPDSAGVLAAEDVQGVLVPGQTTFFVVNASVPAGQTAFLDAWIDFGIDGRFDRGDRIATAIEVVDGENLLTVIVPASAASGTGDIIGDTVARFRISNTGSLPATGVATGGEVEDHRVTLLNNDLGLPRNTPPSFDPDAPTTINVPEDSTLAVGVLQDVLPGARDNQVENDQQSLLPPTVAVVADPNNIIVPGTLMVVEVPQADGTVDYDLTYTARQDANGSVDVAITLTDDQSPAETTVAAVTLVFDPVNDPPQLVDVPADEESDQRNENSLTDSYTVDDQNGVITYRINEDLAPDPESNRPAPATFVIPLNQSSIDPDFNRFGILDLFTPGPIDEQASQQIRLVGLIGDDGTVSDTVTTAIGGTVTINRLAGQLEYSPPADVNSATSGLDSFTYVIADEAISGTLDNPQPQTGRVDIDLLSVNDVPTFDLNQTTATIVEDSPETTFTDFASNIAAGPSTAFDENNGLDADDLEFELQLINPMDPLQIIPASTFFETLTITDGGDLIVEPLANVFGSFTVNVVLQDTPDPDGPNGDDESGAQSSDQFTLVINPVNDDPQIDPANQPNLSPIAEDAPNGPLVISRQSLLDAFRPGPTTTTVPDMVSEDDQTLSIENDPIGTSAGGTITVDPNTGDFLYTPAANFNGTDQLVYTVVDDADDPGFGFNTVDITVTAVNDAPQFTLNVADVLLNETAEPQTVSEFLINVAAGPDAPVGTDDDESGQVLTPQVTLINSGNPNLFAVAPTVSIDGAGNATLSFTPQAFENGSADFEITLTDSGNPSRSTSDVFSITVGAVDDPPTFTLNQDTIAIDEGAGTVITDVIDEVSSGASNEDPTVNFSVRVVDPEDRAKFTIEPDFDDNGNLIFALGPDEFTTEDDLISLEITASDLGNNLSDPRIITLSVTNTPDVPVANDDSKDTVPVDQRDAFITTEDEVRRIRFDQLLGNDTDADLPDDELTIQLPGAAVLPSGEFGILTELGATVTIVGNELRYDPTGSDALQSLTSPNEVAVDTFEYFAVDRQRDDDDTPRSSVAPATVSIDVSGLNDAPIATGQEIERQTTGVSLIPVMVTDPDGNTDIDFTSLEITFRPSLGTVTYDPTLQRFRYEPTDGLIGEDQFRYTIADQSGAVSNEAIIRISTNPAPIARADRFGIVQGRSGVFNIVANDTDNSDQVGMPGVDPASIQIVTPPAIGTVEVLTDNPGSIRYTAADGTTGTDSFTYTIADNEGVRSAPVRVEFVIRSNALQNPSLDTGVFDPEAGNEFRNTDVNDDNEVTPIDALLVINALRRFSAGGFDEIEPDENGNRIFRTDSLDYAPDENIFFWDVDGNNVIEPLDALLVINRLRREGIFGESESVAESEMVTTTLGGFNPIDTASPIVDRFEPRASVNLAAEIEAFQTSQRVASFAADAAGSSSSLVSDELVTLVAEQSGGVTAAGSTLDQAIAELTL